MNTLYTAGYTGLKPDDLERAVEKLNALLVDIRLSPMSRVEYWYGSALSARFRTNYHWLPDLGNLHYKNPELGICLRNADAGTFDAVQLLEKKPVIFLCACADVEGCHRKLAAQEMADRYNVQVVHLTTDELKGKPVQPTLF